MRGAARSLPTPLTSRGDEPQVLARRHVGQQPRRGGAKLWVPKSYAKALRAVAEWVKPEPAEHPGRKFGKPHGTWIDDLSARAKAIMLCRGCAHRFAHARHRYYRDRKFPWVIARCDGCRQLDQQAVLYIHESVLAEPDGRLRPGQCWTPR